jgi:hypothetical protein
MPASRPHRGRVAGAIGALLVLADDRQLAFEDEEARVELVGVLGVCSIRRSAISR